MFWYLPSNSVIAKVVSITLTYMFMFKIANNHWAVPTDLPPLVWHSPSSCVKYHKHFKSSGATPVACTQWSSTQLKWFRPRRRHTFETMSYLGIITHLFPPDLQPKLAKLISWFFFCPLMSPMRRYRFSRVLVENKNFTIYWNFQTIFFGHFLGNFLLTVDNYWDAHLNSLQFDPRIMKFCWVLFEIHYFPHFYRHISKARAIGR